MRKIFFYIIIIISLTFLFPVIFTSKITSVQIAGNVEHNTVDKKEYNYNEYGTIKLMDSKTGEVSNVELDVYLLRSCK